MYNFEVKIEKYRPVTESSKLAGDLIVSVRWIECPDPGEDTYREVTTKESLAETIGNMTSFLLAEIRKDDNAQIGKQ